jgi:D-alanine-D-alanine ligase-like ATP-grasp enzyme
MDALTAVSARDRLAEPTLPHATSLKRVIVIYESRRKWIDRVVNQGLSSQTAEITSHWLFGEEDIQRTILGLQSSTERLGIHIDVKPIEIFQGGDVALLDLQGPGVLAWNITDGHAAFRGSHVPSLAILANVPYFGCPPLAQAIAQDKFKLFLFCKGIGIPTPATALMEGSRVLSGFVDGEDVGPYFIKPNSLGNKVGITEDSIQLKKQDALEHASLLGEKISDRILIQRFIEGFEIRLTFINGAANPDEPQFGFDLISDLCDRHSFVSAKSRNSKYKKFRNFRAARNLSTNIREDAVAKMCDAVRVLAMHFVLRDYFTIDFKIDNRGIAWLLDFNSGAFLHGKDVEGYTNEILGVDLPTALVRGFVNSFYDRQCGMFKKQNYIFRG